MTPDGLADEVEFQKLLEGADPLTRAMAMEIRATRKAFDELPCHDERACPIVVTRPSRRQTVVASVSGGGVVAIVIGIIEIVSHFLH